MRLLLLLYFTNLSQCFTRIIPTNVIYYGRKLQKPILFRGDGEVEWPELDSNYDDDYDNYNKYMLYKDTLNISYKYYDNGLNKTIWKNFIRKGNND